MAFRVCSVLLALVMAVAASAETLIPLCVVSADSSFETLHATAAEAENYPDALEGPCNEFLGQLCDDSLKCTMDFDYEEVKCLPEPREVMDSCVETTE
ncbi:unnamed protein product [Ectocarpus sp. 6 AP-2014]|uniref:Uncharacterized protein n=1 Tax=Ectocarpus siliculosus TaxID=2880 RepID=D8LGV0_ECTSI|nr:expressed unknown protein [Ectocarpus siliculosus]|eukprot:CBN75803.1 expressed unknown protein [Ectocarpus siliculosus]